MLSKELRRKQGILRVLSDVHSVAILLELVDARDTGQYPVSHKDLNALVNVLHHETINWQWSKQKLVDDLQVVEMLVDETKPNGVDNISYQLNPNMDAFSAQLIEMLFKGEKGMRDSLVPDVTTPHV